jgi:phospholipid/cholesterol/gamma-HCH transport system substrate-binding protein
LNLSTKKIEGVLNSNTDNINSTIENFRTTSDNLSKMSDTLSKIEFNRIVQNADETLLNLKEISNKLKNGDGSLGKLMNDDQMYINLENATKELEELLSDVKLNPKRYVHFSVFGKNSVKYKNSED